MWNNVIETKNGPRDGVRENECEKRWSFFKGDVFSHESFRYFIMYKII